MVSFEALEPAVTVPERVAGVLRRAILQGELAVGERLPSEQSLADQFQTNRVSLRQALQLLKADRLIEGGQGRSWRVCDFRTQISLGLLPDLFAAYGISPETLDVMRHFLRIRAPFLCEVVGLAAQRASEEQLEMLRSTLVSLKESAPAAREKGDFAALFALDLAWFEALIDASNSLLYRSIYGPIAEVYRRFGAQVAMLWEPPDAYPGALVEIQVCVETHDAAGAQALLVTYLNEEERRMNERWESMDLFSAVASGQ